MSESVHGVRMHGGPDAHGAAPHDFSTNANACGPCPPVLAAVRQADAARYPDPGYHALRRRLAGFHGVEAARIVVAASASEFIVRISAHAARQGWDVCLPPHGYGDYAHAAAMWGLRPRQHSAGALLWLCEPSSPLGQLETRWDGWQAAACVVLDRAYEPLRLHGRCAIPQATLDAVWQLWSPNKALGLTGVRGAYAIAPRAADAQVAALDALAPSWPLGAHGLAMLDAWCDDGVQQWLAASRAQLRDWHAMQCALLARLGWALEPGVANFMAGRCPPGEAARVVRLRAHGVQLRDCTSFGLPGLWRLAVGTPAAQHALAGAWTAAGEGA